MLKNGNGIYLTSSPGKVIFNQIVGNKFYGLYNTATGVVNATNNWWGTNKPTTTGKTSDIHNNGGTLNYDSYLVLTLTTSTDRSDHGDKNYKYFVVGDLNHDNHGKNTIPEGTVPDGIPIGFATTLGTLNNSTCTTKKGQSVVILKNTSTGTAILKASLDNQIVTKNVQIRSITVQAVTKTRTGKKYSSIQDAVDDTTTQNEDTITLDEGIYTENILINKKITLTPQTGVNVVVKFKDENKGVIVIGHEGSGSIIQNLNIISSTQSYGIATSQS